MVHPHRRRCSQARRQGGVALTLATALQGACLADPAQLQESSCLRKLVSIGSRAGRHGHRGVGGAPSSGQVPRPAFTRRFPCVRRGRRLSAAQNPPPVFPRKTSAGGFGLAPGIAFTEEHALFRFRQFLHRFDDFGDGDHAWKKHTRGGGGKGAVRWSLMSPRSCCVASARKWNVFGEYRDVHPFPDLGS